MTLAHGRERGSSPGTVGGRTSDRYRCRMRRAGSPKRKPHRKLPPPHVPPDLAPEEWFESGWTINRARLSGDPRQRSAIRAMLWITAGVLALICAIALLSS